MAGEQARDRRIVAQEDTNLFGGSFTPFRDLWNSVAGDLGITTKRMREDALARAAEEEAIWRDTSSALTAELERQRSEATSPEDLGQLRVLETQLDLAGRLRQSSNPKLAEAGINMLGKVTDAQRAFAERQEVDAIAREASENAQRTALGAERWSRFSTAYDDLHRESQDFLAIQSSYRALQAAYSGDGEPGNANDIAAINSLQRMIDPGVSVREGDVSLLQNLAGVPEWLVTAANRVAKGGGRFTPAERRSIAAVGRQLMTAANAQQSETNVRFQDLGIAAELPDDYVGKLMIPLTDVGGRDAANYGKEQAAAGASGQETPTGVIRDTAQGVGDLYQGARHGVTDALELGANALGAVGRVTRAAAEEAGDLSLPEFGGGIAESLETDDQGMSRGVYVPEFMRRRKAANRRAVND